MYEIFLNPFFPQQGKWIKDFWIPNKNWKTVMMIKSAHYLPKTMEILENKNKAMLDVYSSIAFSFVYFIFNKYL